MNELNDFIEKNGGYWSCHSDHQHEDWRDEVMSGDTQLGYWEWAYNREQEAIA